MAEIIEIPQDNIVIENVPQDQIIDDALNDNIVIRDAQLIRQIYEGENTDTIELNVDNTRRIISANLIKNQYSSKIEFPNVGSDKIIYVDLSDNSLWRFDKTNLNYVCVGRDSSFTSAQWATINSGLTTSDKTKLNGIEEGAEVNDVNSVNGKTGAVILNTSDLTNDSGYITNSVSNLTNYYTKSEIDSTISSVYKPAGSIVFASLPTLSSDVLGNVYNVTDAFTTTNDFAEGTGKSYPAGTNVVVINTGTNSNPIYKFDVLSGFVDLSGYVPTSRTVNNKALTSDINLTASDIGAQPTIDASHKLSADLVDDTTTTNKFVTASDKTNWNNKSNFSGNYNDLTNKPAIPTALSQLSTDTTHRVVTDTEKNTWNNKQDTLPTTSTAGKILKSTSTAGVVEWGDASTASSTVVQVNGTSITSNNVANLITKTAYNSSTNRLATENDLPPSIAITTTSGSESVSDGTNTLTFGLNAFNSKNIPDDGITEISTQYVRITDLDTGVYKLTYNGIKYIYYNGSTSTSAENIVGYNGNVILNVTKVGSYWGWYCYYGVTTCILRFGQTTSSAGTTQSITLNNILTSETDPVFSASAAAGITSTNISNWNNAVTNSFGGEYIRYENGLQMCWGVNWWPSNNASCSYSKAFKSGTSPYVVVTQCGTTSIWENNLKVNDVSSTSFKVNAGGTIAYYWFAIGTWK